MELFVEHHHLSSPVFEDSRNIPKEYTCEGTDINPALIIDAIPEGTQTLALIMDDPDASSDDFVHCIAWNIPPMKFIPENSSPGTVGKNSAGENKYTGPCPPNGTHRYCFKVYALDTLLDLPVTTGKETLEIRDQKTYYTKGGAGRVLSEGRVSNESGCECFSTLIFLTSSSPLFPPQKYGCINSSLSRNAYCTSQIFPSLPSSDSCWKFLLLKT